MLRHSRQIPQQDFKSNDFKRNDDRFYYCREQRHIKQTVQNEEEETIEEIKIQRISEHGNKEKPTTMMMKWKIYVSWHWVKPER